jgi:TRAP-type C4-dicarboxylate transport system permease small subunit
MERSAPIWFLRYERMTKAVNKLFAAIASVLTVAIVLLVLLAVGARLAGTHILWPYDITQFTLVYVVFLAIAPALESGHHVVVELFDRLVPRPVRPYVQYVAAILTIIFAAVFLYHLYRLTSRAFGDDRLAVAAIAVPLKWVYVIGPIGIIQFILTAFAQLGRAHWQTETADHAHGH